MDWSMILLTLLLTAAGIAAASVWNIHKIKKEVFLFESKVEKALDQIITRAVAEETEGSAGQESAEDPEGSAGQESAEDPEGSAGQESAEDPEGSAGQESAEDPEGSAGQESAEDPEGMEELADTLWGKCREKIARVDQICRKKERKSQKEKNQIKQLIADISHQTKTPLANMKLYLEFLQEEPLSGKGMEFLKKLEGQTEKLDFLLQSLVKMSRLEAGVIQIKCEQSPLCETIAKAAAQIVPSAAKKDIELYVECDKKIRIRHDRKWVEEAVFNVLDNAVKYTNPGGHIHVHAICQEIYTKISVHDDGKGILPERQAQIFTRFYREPEIHEQSGIGIGLYLTRQILELQGGYIEVHSDQGQGSEFCLYLPNDQADMITIM